MTRSGLLALPMALAAVAALAQEPTGRLEGRVVEAVTGEPVRGVSVNLVALPPGAARRIEISAADGHFVFENIEAGSYSLMAGPPSAGSGLLVTVRDGQTVRDIVLRTPAQASISGRVIDEEERPVAKAMVMCRDFVFGSVATTGSDGVFRVQGLPPGNCVLMAVPRGGEAEGAEERPLVTFYPSTTDDAAAIPLPVAPGQELSGITVVIRKGRLYGVQGTVVAASPGLSLADVRVILLPRTRAEILASVALKRESGGGLSLSQDGSFDVGRVSPGSYYLRAERAGSSLVLGRLSIDVRGEDLKGLVLIAREPLHLTGTVRIDGDGELDLSRVGIMLTPVEGAQPPWASSTLNAENTFEMWDVPVDDYVVKVSGLPEGAYVKSIRLGSRETTDLRLDLSAMEAVPPIEVVVSPSGATVEGTVKTDGKPLTGGLVRMEPGTAQPGSAERVKTGRTDLKGRFRLSGIAPGEYRVYAVDEAHEAAGEAVKITVEEGERKQVEVTGLKTPEAR